MRKSTVKSLLKRKRDVNSSIFVAMTRRMQGTVRAQVGRIISRKRMSELYHLAMAEGAKMP